MAFDKGRYDKTVEKILSETTDPLMAKLLKGAAAKIGDQIAKGTTATKAVQASLRGLPADMLDALKPGLFQAACSGYGIWPEMVAKPEAVTSTLTETPWTADKMKLSERLHGTSSKMRDAIVGEIKTAMRQNDSWRATAKKLYDGYGAKTTINPADLPQFMAKLVDSARHAAAMGHLDKKAELAYQREVRKAGKLIAKLDKGGTTSGLRAGYSQLLQATNDITEERLQKAIMVATEERARYYADRIARTETARSWFDGFLAQHADDEDVIGYQWVLGSNHPYADLCDMHSKADFYGMGPGAYPKTKIPVYPAHPHCRCHLSPIYEDEAPEPKEYDPAAGDRYLRDASPKTRKAILGVAGEKAWAAGKLPWESAAGKRGWTGHIDIPGRIRTGMIAPKEPGPEAEPTVYEPPELAYDKDKTAWHDMKEPPIPEVIAKGTASIPAAFTFMSWVRSGCPPMPGPEYTWTRTKGAKTGEWVAKGRKKTATPSKPTATAAPAVPTPSTPAKPTAPTTATPVSTTVTTTIKAAAAPTAAKTAFEMATEADLTTVKSLGGSTGAQLAELADGTKVVVKGGASQDHLRNEYVASKLYNAAGVLVPDARLIKGKNGPLMISKYIDGSKTWDDFESAGKDVAQARRTVSKGFVADAIFANWDVAGAGGDNLLVKSADSIYRIDNGGALLFRARGARKSTPITLAGEPYIEELRSLRDHGRNPITAKIFQDLTDKDIADQIEEFAKRRPAIIQALADMRGEIPDAMLNEIQDFIDARIEAALKFANEVKNPPKATAKGIRKQYMPAVDAKKAMARLKPSPTEKQRQEKLTEKAVSEYMAINKVPASKKKQVQAAAINTLQTAVNQAKVCHRINPHIITDFLLPGDGRIKSQFETGSSNGALDEYSRSKAENEMFGYERSMERKERPVYGYMSDDPRAEAQGNLGCGASHYGSVIFVMKEELRKRTTVTFGDSLGLGAIPCPAEKVTLEAGTMRPGKIATLNSGKTKTVDSLLSSSICYSYVECQFHGGLSLDDVATVIIPKGRVPGWAELKKKLEDNGFDVEVY